MSWWLGGYLPWDRIREDFARMHRVDARGDRIHLAFALGWCFLMGWPMSFTEIALAPLGVTYAARLWLIRHAARWAFVTPLGLALLAWSVWQGVTLLWTPDWGLGVKQVAALRFCAAYVFLWPVLEHRRSLIAALGLGFLCTVLSQAASFVGYEWGIEWLQRWDYREHARNGGWWGATQTGEVLAVAVALYLPTVMMGRGKPRAWAGVATLMIVGGLAATGTRAGWVAGLVALTASAYLAVRRLPGKAAAKRLAWVGVGAVLAGAVGVGVAGPGFVASRYERVRQEIGRALNEGDYATNDGMRVLLARWGVEAWREKPVVGHGSGSYRAWVLANKHESGRAYEWFRDANFIHPHNTLLHVAVTAGLVGVVLALGVIGLAWREASRGRTPLELGVAAGIAAVVGLTPFDSLGASGRPASVVGAVVALAQGLGWRRDESA
jgi:O-antigen ligase